MNTVAYHVSTDGVSDDGTIVINRIEVSGIQFIFELGLDRGLHLFKMQTHTADALNWYQPTRIEVQRQSRNDISRTL